MITFSESKMNRKIIKELCQRVDVLSVGCSGGHRYFA